MSYESSYDFNVGFKYCGHCGLALYKFFQDREPFPYNRVTGLRSKVCVVACPSHDGRALSQHDRWLVTMAEYNESLAVPR